MSEDAHKKLNDATAKKRDAEVALVAEKDKVLDIQIGLNAEIARYESAVIVANKNAAECVDAGVKLNAREAIIDGRDKDVAALESALGERLATLKEKEVEIDAFVASHKKKDGLLQARLDAESDVAVDKERLEGIRDFNEKECNRLRVLEGSLVAKKAAITKRERLVEEREAKC